MPYIITWESFLLLPGDVSITCMSSEVWYTQMETHIHVGMQTHGKHKSHSLPCSMLRAALRNPSATSESNGVFWYNLSHTLAVHVALSSIPRLNHQSVWRKSWTRGWISVVWQVTWASPFLHTFAIKGYITSPPGNYMSLLFSGKI